MKKAPILTVVMPVHNGEKYLQEAIDSVLNQSFNDFELIIINDGSTDKSVDIIKSYTDSRIRLINNKKNYGIPYSRNLGLREAKGEFLAWSDCDDVNLMNRFETQIDFLKNHKEYGVCGSGLIYFGEKTRQVCKPIENDEIVKATLLFKTSIPNPTAMFRLSKVREFGLTYNENFPICEDYDFYLRSSMLFPVTNITEVLYKYRSSETSIMKKFESQEMRSDHIHKVIYVKALNHLGIKPQESDLFIHRLISSEKLFDNFSDFTTCYRWLAFLKSKNNETKVYNDKIFNKVLAERFCFISKKASKFGVKTLAYYLTRSFMNFGYVSIYDIFKLAFRCVIRYNKFSLSIIK